MKFIMMMILTVGMGGMVSTTGFKLPSPSNPWDYPPNLIPPKNEDDNSRLPFLNPGDDNLLPGYPKTPKPKSPLPQTEPKGSIPILEKQIQDLPEQ